MIYYFQLSAHKQHFFKDTAVKDVGVISHVRLTMRPDGGISRLRVSGFKQHLGQLHKDIEEHVTEQ